MIEIVLTGAPMGKERVKRGAAGNAYTPERTVRFESRLALAAQGVMAGRPLLEGPLVLDLVALMPVPESKSQRWRTDALAGRIRPTKKPDWDNFAKILDALNLVVWVDDAQVVCGHVEKFYSERPLFAVRVGSAPAGAVLPEWVRPHVGEGIFA